MKKPFLLLSVLVVTLGMSSLSQAADMPVKAPPPPPPPPFSWTGFYLGGNIGGAWAQRNLSDDRFGLDFSRSSDTVFIAGGQLGFNYQFNTFVLGVEWDFDWAANNSDSGNGVVVPGVGTLQVSGRNKWITTLAARFGFAFDRWMIYGKVGGGWVGSDGITVTNIDTGASISGGGSNNASGWLVGLGWEWAFADNWSWKVEYDYLRLSSHSFTVANEERFLAGDTFHGDRNVSMVKLGINYRFGGAGGGGMRY
jgi:outer membrane immunogenic protein